MMHLKKANGLKKRASRSFNLRNQRLTRKEIHRKSSSIRRNSLKRKNRLLILIDCLMTILWLNPSTQSKLFLPRVLKNLTRSSKIWRIKLSTTWAILKKTLNKSSPRTSSMFIRQCITKAPENQRIPRTPKAEETKTSSTQRTSHLFDHHHQIIINIRNIVYQIFSLDFLITLQGSNYLSRWHFWIGSSFLRLKPIFFHNIFISLFAMEVFRYFLYKYLRFYSVKAPYRSLKR